LDASSLLLLSLYVQLMIHCTSAIITAVTPTILCHY
jgi:hypothetical protein